MRQNSLRVTREARGRIPGDGVDLAFGYWPGRGAPVIAIHGLTATYISYIGVAERLAGSGRCLRSICAGEATRISRKVLTAWRSTLAMLPRR
jgi:hypothetical protein